MQAYTPVAGFVESVIGPAVGPASSIAYAVAWNIGGVFVRGNASPNVPRWPDTVHVRALEPGTGIFGVVSSALGAQQILWVAPIEMPDMTECNAP